MTGVIKGGVITGQPRGPAGGDLTGTYPDPTIAAAAVTNAKLANVATSTIKGRSTAGSGDPEDLTSAQVRTLTGLSDSDTPVFSNLTLNTNDPVINLINSDIGGTVFKIKNGIPIKGKFTITDNDDIRFCITNFGNIAIGDTVQFGGGQLVLAIKNADTVPNANPSGGGILYAESGALKWRGPTTTTIIAIA